VFWFEQYVCCRYTCCTDGVTSKPTIRHIVLSEGCHDQEAADVKVMVVLETARAVL
jgi:hypothetical protein